MLVFHLCGFPLRQRVRFNGRDLVIEFVDNSADSPTVGDVVKLCPHCGSKLFTGDCGSFEDVAARAELAPA